ncbi:unnamed protein product [Peronospora effusa]|nr:unnamed protein product [Peronospora effusa]
MWCQVDWEYHYAIRPLEFGRKKGERTMEIHLVFVSGQMNAIRRNLPLDGDEGGSGESAKRRMQSSRKQQTVSLYAADRWRIQWQQYEMVAVATVLLDNVEKDAIAQSRGLGLREEKLHPLGRKTPQCKRFEMFDRVLGDV